MKNNRKYVTLKDIANHCQLSVSTVSKILLGNSNFKEETQKLVFDAARELGYVPNALARQMVGEGSYKQIGFFVPNVLNPFFSELVYELESRLSRHHFTLMLGIFDDDPAKMTNFLKMLVETRVDGCIVAGCNITGCEAAFADAKRYLPMVSIQADVPNVDRVDVTDEEGTFEMVEYLINKGHKKIAFLGYNFDISVLKNRLDGYYRALVKHDIPINPEYVVEGAHSTVRQYQEAKKLLEAADPPTAIHCINEFTALAAYTAIQDKGLRIPEDISITGFDGLAISNSLNPRLTTIQDPIDLLASIAVDMLLTQIDGKETEQNSKQVFVRHRFLERNSVLDKNN